VDELSDDELAAFVKRDARWQSTAAAPSFLPGVPPSCVDLAPYWCARFELEGRKKATPSGGEFRLDPKESVEGIARRLVDWAFRFASRKHHPDHGGSHEGMVRLAQARDALLKAVNPVH